MHHLSARIGLLNQLVHDWDGQQDFDQHILDWQKDLTAIKLALLSEALGNYRREAHIQIPPRTIYRWFRAANIQPPRVDRRRPFVEALIKDWDRLTPLKDHTESWQDLSDPRKYSLVFEALGGRFQNKPVPFTTIQKWIRDLSIEIPRSRRTSTPSKRTLYRWSRSGLNLGPKPGTE